MFYPFGIKQAFKITKLDFKKSSSKMIETEKKRFPETGMCIK
jgi:hypothetical protein